MAEASTPWKLETGIVFSASERNSRWAYGVMVGSLAVATICGGLSVPGAREIGWGLPLGLVAAATAAIVAGNYTLRRGAPSPGEVELRDDSFVFRVRGKRQRIIPRAAVAEGYMEAPSRVVYRMREGLEVAFDAPDEATARKWLEAAGVSVSARMLRMPLASAASRVVGGEVAAALLLLYLTPTSVLAGSWTIRSLLERIAYPEIPWSFFGTFVPPVVLFAVVSALFRFMRARMVVVGTDGVVFYGYFGKRLVPYSAMRGVHRHSHGVFLLLSNGKRLLLPVRARSLTPLPVAPQAAHEQANAGKKEVDENLVRRETLLMRIEQAMATHGQSHGARLAIDRLDRKDKPFSSWLSELRELCGEKGGYREGRVVPEDLVAVVEDSGATPERRIGAAVALSTAGDDETKRRIRIAVHACADEELRAALEEAAAGEIREARVARLEKRYRA